MKPFNIDLVKSGTPVITREGKPARVICTDAKGFFPVIALIDYGLEEAICRYNINGSAIYNHECSLDLFLNI